MPVLCLGLGVSVIDHQGSSAAWSMLAVQAHVGMLLIPARAWCLCLDVPVPRHGRVQRGTDTRRGSNKMSMHQPRALGTHRGDDAQSELSRPGTALAAIANNSPFTLSILLELELAVRPPRLSAITHGHPLASVTPYIYRSSRRPNISPTPPWTPSPSRRTACPPTSAPSSRRSSVRRNSRRSTRS